VPVYFFDLIIAGDLAPDEEGTELSSMDDVQNEAAYALADMLRDDVRATMGNPCARHLSILVRDSQGPVLEAKYSFEVARLQ
jgi:hypothetical protein